MAKKAKAKAKVKKAARKADKGVGDTLRDTALGVVDEVEKASGVVLEEIKSSFEFIGGKVADTAKTAADTTIAVKDKVTSKEVTDQLHGLVKDVEEVGDSLLNVITSHFDSLRKTVAKPVKKTRKKAVKKKAGKKKVSKKKTAKKKTATRKKAAVRKKPARKKVTRKKAVKKKAVARKKPARKKTVRKAPAKKKTGARKKTTTRKTARKKTVSKKKTARKTARKR